MRLHLAKSLNVGTDKQRNRAAAAVVADSEQISLGSDIIGVIGAEDCRWSLHNADMYRWLPATMFLAGNTTLLVALLVARVSSNAGGDIPSRESAKQHQCEEQHCEFFAHLSFSLVAWHMIVSKRGF